MFKTSGFSNLRLDLSQLIGSQNYQIANIHSFYVLKGEQHLLQDVFPGHSLGHSKTRNEIDVHVIYRERAPFQGTIASNVFAAAMIVYRYYW
jgi:hypothetical protein